jgi:hypothetical protein
MDLFVVPTIGFDLLYAYVIVRLDRRELVWISVTTHPTAEWVARQITEAFPWNEAPRYMLRDRDRIYGAVVTRRLRAMGIRDNPRQRLAAELSFLFDSPPGQVNVICAAIKSHASSHDLVSVADRLAPLSKANLSPHVGAREQRRESPSFWQAVKTMFK